MMKNLRRTALLTAALVGACGLYRFWQFVSDPPAKLHKIKVEERLLRIYTFKSLVDFAKKHPVLETNDELALMIEQDGMQKYWLATLVRWHQWDNADIETSYNPLIIHPGRRADQFLQNRAFLKTLAGNPPDDYHANAEIVVVPEHLVAIEPGEALMEVLEPGQRPRFRMPR